MNTMQTELERFAAEIKIYYQVAAKRHGNAWLCSLRSKMRLDRETFERLALAAHQADLIVLGRADLTDTADTRYLEESALQAGNYTFHFMTDEII